MKQDDRPAAEILTLLREIADQLKRIADHLEGR
jgi:hypothetical protein